ncbi:MAG: hypothetical protein KDE28_29550, partial [Anaerolineales bacterium]|nr:hypothetical protein [Anaerolineales bacterium]
MKSVRLFLVLLLLAFMIVACGGSDEESTPEAASPTEAASESTSEESTAEESSTDGGAEASGELAQVRIGWAGSPDTLNPGTAVLSEAYTLFELVYDSMYQLQPDGTYTLELAESVDVSDDGLTYT